MYKVPSAVQGLVADGDTVEIDAGTYNDCATWTKNNLFLTGVGGMAHLDSSVCGQKGIWVFYGNNITAEYIEFSGAAISFDAGDNGAGIRAQGGSFTVRHCYFHDNQEGILCDPAVVGSKVLIEYSEFARNGVPNTSAAGYEHNMYIGNNISGTDTILYDSFTLQYCYVHGAIIGHNVKSRAGRNFILYNRIMDESTGTSSRDIDLPNGGFSVIMGNLIEQGPNTQNSNIMEFGGEGVIHWSGITSPQNLYIINNTIVNDYPSNNSIILYDTEFSAHVPFPVDTLTMKNNIVAGPGMQNLIIGVPKVLDTAANLVNASISAVGLMDPAMYDYSLLPTSPAINAGINIGPADGFSLVPAYEYVHPDSMMSRPVVGQIDQGAYEYASNSSVAEQGQVSGFGITVVDDPLAHQAVIYISGGAANGCMTVYDILGRPIEIIPSIHNNTLRLDTSTLPDGVYFARFNSPSGNAEAKFVVTK